MQWADSTSHRVPYIGLVTDHQSPLANLSLNCCSSLWFCSSYPTFLFLLHWDGHLYVCTSTSQSGLSLLYIILWLLATFLGASLFHTALLSPWLALCSRYGCPFTGISSPQSLSAFLNPLQCFLIPVRTPQHGLAPFYFILHSSITLSILHFSPHAFPILFSSLPGHCFWRSPEFVIFPYKPNSEGQLANIPLHLCEISESKSAGIGFLFHPLARYNILATTLRPSCW